MQEHIGRVQGLIREILGEDYLALRVDRYTFEEDVRTNRGRIRCELRHDGSGQPEVIEGEGVGIIDAFFHGLKAHFARSCPSLQSIQFVSFGIRGDMDTRRHASGADAEGEVVLGVRNTAGAVFEFRSSSRSVAGSAVEVTLKAVGYFVNSERAFIQSYKAMRHAKDRGRQDLVEVYTRHLAELVRNTSYSEVIEDIRRQMEDRE